MKTLIVQLSENQLTRIITEAQAGDLVVLTDGNRKMFLNAGHADAEVSDLDLDEGQPELAAELLMAGKGRFVQRSREELEALAEKIRREKAGDEKPND